MATTRGEVASQIVEEFQELWDSPYALDFDSFYEVYRTRYEIIKHQREEAKKDAIPSFEKFALKPNSMQEVFIANLRAIMEKGENRALLISATGTGKTYASAFAMRELGFRRVLFLVHRAQLAKQAKKSFERVFNNSVSMGIVGAGAHEYDCDFIFAMVETLNRDAHLFHYEKDAFDCIILDEAEILRLFLERNQVSYAEIVESCRTRYDYVIAEEEIDAACDVLSGNFVINEKEREKFRQMNLLEMDGKQNLRGARGYAERLSHKDFYDQLKDIISVALARFQDKYAKPYGDGVPFTLYEKYSRRDVSLLINAGKDLSSTMYGMYGDGEDVFLFVTYHKEETTDADKQYVDGKPDYADEFIDNSIFRWDSQIGKKLGGEYMNKVLHTPRKHLFVQKTDKENNFFYMGEFNVIDKHQEEKKSNNGLMQPICKLKLQMHTPVREDILQYLQSNVLTEGNAV